MIAALRSGRPRPGQPPASPRRRGMSYTEVTVATLIVGMLLVAALRTVGSATQASRITADRTVGMLLAQDLVAEILNVDYSEPTETAVFGIEASESSTSRVAYDDVDDYAGWSATPPQHQDGSAMADKANWRRDVAVRYVDPNDLTMGSATDQNIKEVTVSVYYRGQLVAQQVVLRADVE